MGTNARLRLVVDKAYTKNMPKETIERAIKRGAGAGEGVDLQEVRYEGYGPGGVAILVDCLTDNRNRTVAEVRHAFSKHGGSLGGAGSVGYLFEQKGIISIAPGVKEETVLEIALQHDADDVTTCSDQSIEVVTPTDTLPALREALTRAGIAIQGVDISHLPTTSVLLDTAGAETLEALVGDIEDLDDVQNVYTNAAFS